MEIVLKKKRKKIGVAFKIAIEPCAAYRAVQQSLSICPSSLFAIHAQARPQNSPKLIYSLINTEL